MISLLLVTLIWGFSFGLVKGNLAGVDPLFISFARLAIAVLFFLPFARWKNVPRLIRLKLLLVGAFQFGFMYIAYNTAFQFLKAYEVAILTISTPLLVVLLQSGLDKRIKWVYLLTSLIACAGAAVIVFSVFETQSGLLGVVLVQVSNLFFAFGQVYYRKVMAGVAHIHDAHIFSLLYIGAALATGALSALFTPWKGLHLSVVNIWTLVYLGAIASGGGFFLWNFGARRVNPGALAVMNDLKIPVATTVSLLVFGEQADWKRLLIGGGIIVAALVLNELMCHKRPGEFLITL